MKSFGQKSWMLPQPVLIIGTYDKERQARHRETFSHLIGSYGYILYGR